MRYDGRAQLFDTARIRDLLVVASFSGGGSRVGPAGRNPHPPPVLIRGGRGPAVAPSQWYIAALLHDFAAKSPASASSSCSTWIRYLHSAAKNRHLASIIRDNRSFERVTAAASGINAAGHRFPCSEERGTAPTRQIVASTIPYDVALHQKDAAFNRRNAAYRRKDAAFFRRNAAQYRENAA